MRAALDLVPVTKFAASDLNLPEDTIAVQFARPVDGCTMMMAGVTDDGKLAVAWYLHNGQFTATIVDKVADIDGQMGTSLQALFRLLLWISRPDFKCTTRDKMVTKITMTKAQKAAVKSHNETSVHNMPITVEMGDSIMRVADDIWATHGAFRTGFFRKQPIGKRGAGLTKMTWVNPTRVGVQPC